MPEVVSFTAPYDVALVPCDPQPLVPGSVRLRTWYSGISAGTELTAYRGSNPYLTAHLGRRAPAVRRRRPDLRLPGAGLGLLRGRRGGRGRRRRRGARRRRRGARHLGSPQRGRGPGRRGPRPDLDRGRRHLRHLRAGRLDRPQRRAGGRGPARRPGRDLRPGRDRAAGHPARGPQRRRGGRRRRRARARSTAARAMGAAEVRARPTVDGGAGAAIRGWSGGGVDAAIELSGNDRALHEAVRSVVVDGHRRGLGLLPGRRRAPAPRRGVPPQPGPHRGQPDRRHPGRARSALGPAAAGPHLHGAGAARPGRRPLAGHRRGRRRATWPRSSRGWTEATPRSCRPCCASPRPRRSP